VLSAQPLCAGGARADGDDEIRCRRGADIFDAVFVVGANESNRAGTHLSAFAFDG